MDIALVGNGLYTAVNAGVSATSECTPDYTRVTGAALNAIKCYDLRKLKVHLR